MIDKVGQRLFWFEFVRGSSDSIRIGYARAGYGLPILARSVGRVTASGCGRGNRTDLLRQPVQRQDCATECRFDGAGKGDLAIEFQTDEEVAPIVAAKYREAGIPMIAIDIPHPGATYYGANNYEAGLIGGRYLGRWVKEHWHSEIDEILLLELKRAGDLPRMRLSGLLVGINLVLPSAANCKITYLEGDGELGPSLKQFEDLRSTRHHVLVGAINDPSTHWGH